MNAVIEKVLTTPQDLSPGAEWAVQMHPARGMRWKSVSKLETIDRDKFTFSYRTVNADGNPSYALWSWTVTSAGHAAEVLVKWDVFLQTSDRRPWPGRSDADSCAMKSRLPPGPLPSRHHSRRPLNQ